MKLEVIMDNNHNLWLIGASEFKIHKDGQIEPVDKSNIPDPDTIPK